MTKNRLLASGIFGLTLCWLAAGNGFAQEDLSLLEERAMKSAVQRVAPSVVRIETVGGLERIGEMLVGSGPTTGLVVSPDGYIVSSAFNFVQKPASVLATLSDGQRHAAKLVATDHNRMLVLLKVETDQPLAVPEVIPEAQMQVGQWSIAVGRTFDAEQPNVSVGIISAVERVWGKAVQTDAKISPSNYGGPLVDIQGRVFGVLVPLSPQETGVVAGAEWYDSGIGFAVPLEHILSVLPRLQSGVDLHPGILGISLRGTDQFADPPVIAAARVNSPAYEAGLKPDDKIIEIDGQAVVRQTQVKHLLTPRYAGEKIRLAVLRGSERIEREVELIAKLDPYQHPFLGILPLRAAAHEKPAGVRVRYVYPKSPAAKAGIAVGDAIVSFDGKPVEHREALLEKLASATPGKPVRIGLDRSGQALEVELKPGVIPEALPGDLPPAHAPAKAAAGDLPQVGRFAVKVAEFGNAAAAYVPEDYNPALSHGIVVWLNQTGSQQPEELDQVIAWWKPHCDANDLVLLVPGSADGVKWDPSKDLPFIRKAIDSLRSAYNTDAARIVAAGQQTGGSLAYLLAWGNRDLIRGVAAIEAPPAGQLLDNEPIHRLAFYSAAAKESQGAAQIAAGEKRLREMKYPVTTRPLAAAAQPLADDEQAALVRWIDSLDRM